MNNTVKDDLKKTDGRRQTLRNKCLHERHRRDQENAYYEELAELISASITDMSSFSVKPEKCAILQESLKQIKQIKEDQRTSEAVQQSQVSSSKPSVLANDIVGPLLLEALDGFMFVVNSQGKIEFVSENITQYLKYNQDDLVGKSVYNIIHVGDHAQFSNSLLPMSLSSVIHWPIDTSVAKGRTFNCRMLIKPPCEENDDVEIKQTYISQYENLQISAISQPGEKFSEATENTDGLSCLVCIARRLSFSEKTNTMLGIEQFTTRQDLNGNIIAHDSSGIISGQYSCPEFTGQKIHDFCHVNDVQTLNKHFQDVLKCGGSTSGVYRFKLQENRYVFVQTRSKHFSKGNNGQQDYIISTHSVIRECDSVELKGSASTSLMKSIIGQSSIAANQKNQNFGLPPSVSPMAVLSALNQPLIPTSLSPNRLLGLGDDISESMDPFNSGNNWDALIGEVGTSSSASMGSGNIGGINNNGGGLSGGGAATSTSSTWNNLPQAKISVQQQQQQQQMVRNLMNMQQGDKRTQSSFPRSNSYDGNGQKSPGFAPSPGPRSATFQMPGQRNMPMMSYTNQRSPGNSVIGQNRMSPVGSMGYPMQRTPPISAGNLNQPLSWNRLQQQQQQQQQNGRDYQTPQTSSVMSSPNSTDPMSALQTIGGGIAPSPRMGGEFTFPGSSNEKRSNPRQGKLCQLLAGNSPASSHDKLFRSSSIDSNDSKDRQGLDSSIIKSPADSMQQSSQSSTGQSSPEKPQSTTNIDENDSNRSGKECKNLILKQLLSSDDDDVEQQSMGEQANSAQMEASSDINMEKNEAEPKKPSNALLKQLLSDEHERNESDGTLKKKDKTRKVSGELLQILLNEQENCTSAPAESTSQENDLYSRQRHQSGPQEPQSTTHLSTTSQPLSNSQPLVTSNTTPSSVKSETLPFVNSQFNHESNKKSLHSNTSNLIGDKNLDNLLHSLWEKDCEPMTTYRPPRKRKASGSADSVDSTERLEIESANLNSQSQNSSSKFREKNALLAKLLSKRTPSETVVNTRLTVNPCDTPQTKLPTNLQDKYLSIRPSDSNSRRISVDKNISESKDSKEDVIRGPLKDPLQGPENNNNQVTDNSHMVRLNGGVNLNSAINVSEGNFNSSTSSTQQFQEEYNALQNLLSSSSDENTPQASSTMEIDQPGNTDPLLAHILQQAAELQQDINTGNLAPVISVSVPNEVVQNVGNNQGSVIDDAQFLLEQVIQDSNISLNDFDSLMGMNPQGQPMLEDRVAIEAIQKQLMSEELFSSQNSGIPSSAGQSIQSQAPSRQNSFPVISNQSNQISGGMDMQFPPQMSPQMSPHAQQPSPSQQQGFNQAAANFGPQGPRLPGPHMGAVSSALQLQNGQQQRPVSNQVRQSLIQQQKMKFLREQSRLAKQQEQQRKIMQRQFSGGNAMFNQRFPHNLENFGELMNSGNAPNVTLQRNHIPGPMSPRYGPGIQQQQHPNLSQLIGPSTPISQMSSPFNQPSQNQWNMRQQGMPQQSVPQQGVPQQGLPQQGMQSPMTMPAKNTQYNMNRHRSLSGGTLPNNAQGNNHFQFPEQFGNNVSGQMNVLNTQQQQQQSLYGQGRMLRQMSLPPGRGSPRTPASPFGNSPDPLLMSPHSSVSPNSMRSQPSQVSPPFNQNSLTGSNFGQSPMPTGHQPISSQAQNSMGNPGFQDFEMQLSDLDNKSMKTQYVKQELRNICTARSDQKQLQSQQQQQQQQQQQTLQQSQQAINQPQSQQPTTTDYDSEIPFDIIEQINEMEKEHQAKASSGFNIDILKEDDILKMKRQEAKRIYDQFKMLSTPEKLEPTTENAEIKASAIFRNQLLNPPQSSQPQAAGNMMRHNPDAQQVQVVAKEPRGNCEDMKPPDHKNSLLQQLLSE